MLPTEIESRYLVRTLPPNLQQCRKVAIRQAYVSPFYDAELLEIARRERFQFQNSATLRDLRDLVRATSDKGFRVRELDGQYFLTFKGRRDPSFSGAKRVEIETTEESSATVREFVFDRFFAASPSVEKMRHYLPIGGGLTAEIDVFTQPAGVILVEVEFDSVAAGERFTPPDFCGASTQVSNRDLAMGFKL